MIRAAVTTGPFLVEFVIVRLSPGAYAWERWRAAGADGAVILARSPADVAALVTAVERWKERRMATYALIPGGGGDPWEWHRLAPELEARGHEALAIRLPSEDDTAGWAEYADAVVDALGDRRDIIVVAESMGSFTAPLVCTRRPVDLIVLLNAMIPVPGETFNAWWLNTDSESARREYHASIGLEPTETDDDAVIYYHDLPIALSAEAQARTWQDQSMTPLEQPWPLRAWPDVPTRVLAGRHDRMFPLEFQRRIARVRLGLEVEEIDGGHMVAMSNPRALADRLEAYRVEAQRERRSGTR